MSGGTTGGGTGGNSGGNGHGGNSGGAGGGGGTGGGNSTYGTGVNQQNAPEYIRTFYKPEEVAVADVIKGNEVGGYKPTLIEGIHSGGDITPKPVVAKPKPKAPAMRVPRAPRVTKTGPEDSLVVLTIVIAVFLTLALSVRRSSMYSLPQ